MSLSKKITKKLTLVPLFQVIGNIKPPPAIDLYLKKTGGVKGAALILFLNNILKLMIVLAGLFALFQLILAGYDFISAGGDTKKVTNAFNKIWQALLGLIIVAASFTIAGIVGKLFFGDWTAITNPVIYGPQ